LKDKSGGSKAALVIGASIGGLPWRNWESVQFFRICGNVHDAVRPSCCSLTIII